MNVSTVAHAEQPGQKPGFKILAHLRSTLKARHQGNLAFAISLTGISGFAGLPDSHWKVFEGVKNLLTGQILRNERGPGHEPIA